ncbi:Acetylornithine deacetylase [Hyphomicrobiales bacterium]|nr:Acetylornithine deacetylase [Hyphomicrobiales bacterium]CAH1691208.1 Acetylornithine deacetylase [Hyphomicrobiales bacterium]
MIEKTQELLARLISFKTVSSEPNLPLIEFCRDLLITNGIESAIYLSPEEGKASLHARIGPNVAGGVVLSGHTDVVPTTGQNWASNPWVLTERDMRLVGRGTSDMLGFVAAVLASVPMFRDAKLRRPLHIALSYDEEVGCKGGRILVDTLSKSLPPPVAVIVGEPSGNELVEGHKAYVELIARVKGHAVHSSRPDLGASALTAAARLVCWLDDAQRANALDPALQDWRFEPPYTTLHCGTLHAGTSPTAVADSAVFSVDIRTIPSEDPGAHLQQLRTFALELEQSPIKAGAPSCAIDIEVVTDIPGLSPEENGSAQAFMRSIGLTSKGKTFSGGTEAGLFQMAGWSTVVCGPGELTRAHKADEYIEIRELTGFAEILQRIAHRLAEA